MTVLNGWLLLGAAGIALPILAHLFNRYEVKRTDWAAMRFLDRSVRVRSRQLRLRDVLLLILRCLALLLVVAALSRPAITGRQGVMALLGEPRAGVVIALDGSFSMRHGRAGDTRFDRALRRIETITGTMRSGDPVTLVLLGGAHRVVARNVAFVPEAFAELLRGQQATCEALDLDSVPRRLKDLAAEMKAQQKEVYIVTDLQARDWQGRSRWLRQAFADLADEASVFVVPVGGDAENLAITGLELVSGVLRKGTAARYRATVRNCGAEMAEGVRVRGLLNGIGVDAKVIPSIAPGTSESVSLFLPFRDARPVRIAAELGEDALAADNVRRAVAVIRDRVSVLSVAGAAEASEGASGLLEAALRARGGRTGPDDLAVRSVSWVDLPAQDLARFDVVILANVPDITSEQAAAFEQYVRGGNGLIWFGGDQVKSAEWNRRSARDGTPLLPAVIEDQEHTSDAAGVGRPLDPTMADHPVCRPLLSLPEDLLSEARFHTLLRVRPAASGMAVLSLAGSEAPVLLEHGLGRGHVFMFTTTAGTGWNNMAVTPVFPMLLQQMVTYLTAREFETPRLVGDALSLSYVDRPDAADAVFETPSATTVSVPVTQYRDQYAAVLRDTREAGFYVARASLQAEGMPIAVNVDTRESLLQSVPAPEAGRLLAETGVRVVGSDDALLAGMAAVRTRRSVWRALMLAGLVLLVAESLVADRLSGRAARTEGGANG